MGGIAAACLETSTYSIVSSFEVDEREKYIGYVEASQGAGMLISPALGGLLYAWGGFRAPFWIFGGMMLLLYPYSSYVLSQASKEAYQELIRYRSDPVLSRSLPVPVFDQEDIKISDFLCKKRFTFALLARGLQQMEFAFLLPIISLIYTEFGMPKHFIGLAIGAPYIFYMISCPLIFLLVNKIDKRGIIIIGLIFGTSSMVMVGFYDALHEFFKDNEDIDGRYVMVLTGACGICIAMALVNVPTMPEML